MRISKRALALVLAVVSCATIALQFPAAASGGWVISYDISDSCVEVQGRSKENSAQVQIWGCHAIPVPAHHIWNFNNLSNGYYHIWNENSGKCMNVQGGVKTNSAKVIQYTCQGLSKTNDQWKLQYYGGGLHGDVYYIINRNSGKCLNVQGGSWDDGTDLIQYTCVHAAPNELFTWWPANDYG
jgi:hypothetical protein